MSRRVSGHSFLAFFAGAAKPLDACFSRLSPLHSLSLERPSLLPYHSLGFSKPSCHVPGTSPLPLSMLLLLLLLLSRFSCVQLCATP